MALQLAHRDLGFLDELGEAGLLSADDARRRHYNAATVGGIKYTQRRFRQMAAKGLIEVNRVTLNTDRGPRKLPNVVRLLPAGADEVEAALGERPPREVRSDPPTLVTLMHRVGVVRVLLAIKDACRHEGLPSPCWILEQDTYPDAKPGAKRHEQFVLYEKFGATADQRAIACRPDASVCIQLPGTPTLVAYLEYDRSTDKKEQILRKVAAYRLLLNPVHNTYQRHWPDVKNPFPRVLMVCRSRERIENICELIRSLDGAQYFRLAMEKDLDERLLAEPIWRASNDKPTSPGRSILPASKHH